MLFIFYFFTFLLGLIIGSFLNCLIWRLHTEESILGRSHCPKCGAKIAWYDNIPVLSYLLLRGKCRSCKQKISIQYPLLELIVGFLFFLSAYHMFGGDILFFRFSLSDFLKLFKYWFVASVMVLIFIYDLRWYLILDLVSIPSIILIFFLNIALGFDWKFLLLSALVGGGFFALQYIVSRGRWIGGGDIRMGVLMGVILSWPNVLLALFLAYISGGIFGIILIILRKKEMSSEIPFGTFLSVATLLTLFWGDLILDWYLTAFIPLLYF